MERIGRGAAAVSKPSKAQAIILDEMRRPGAYIREWLHGRYEMQTNNPAKHFWNSIVPVPRPTFEKMLKEGWIAPGIRQYHGKQQAGWFVTMEGGSCLEALKP